MVARPRRLAVTLVVALIAASACGRASSDQGTVAGSKAASPTDRPATTAPSADLRDAGYGHGFGWALTDGLFITRDFGVHWTRDSLPVGIPSEGAAIDVIDASAAVTAWVASRADGSVEVARTTDAGATWQTTVVSVKPQMAHGVSLSFGDVHRGWLTVDEQQTMNTDSGELFETGDGGATWHSRTFESGHMEFLASGRGFAFPLRSPRPVTTSDGGGTWALAPSGPADGPPVFVDALNGYWALGGKVFRSTDGGANWAAVAELPASTDYPKLAAASLTRLFEVAFNPMRLWESLDSGQHWAQVAAAGFDAGSDGVWISGNDGWAFSRNVGSCTGFKSGCSMHTVLLGTHDGGKSWKDVGLPA